MKCIWSFIIAILFIPTSACSKNDEIKKDGYQGGRWILLDLSDIIVHIFHKEEREYYNLERLWTEDLKPEDLESKEN